MTVTAETVPARAHKELPIALIGWVLLLIAGAVFYFTKYQKKTSGPGVVTKISEWNKTIVNPVLSPDGNTLAFTSSTAGVNQVYVMITSGGSPLQLTFDAGSKVVDSFSSDGKEIYYGRTEGQDETWAVPTLGGSPRRIVSGIRLRPSPDGKSLFYTKSGKNSSVFRSDISGRQEQLVRKFEDFPEDVLVYPDSSRLLILTSNENDNRKQTILRMDLAIGKTETIGIVEDVNQSAWGEPGKTLLLSRTINGIQNLWQYDLETNESMQLTFGQGPDTFPMQDPQGKGIYFISGVVTGSLTSFEVATGRSSEIVNEVSSQPNISPDGKRIMYIVFVQPGVKEEIWVSSMDGTNPVKIATEKSLGTGTWSADGKNISYVLQTDAGSRGFIASADGRSIHELTPMPGAIQAIFWALDGKHLYVTIRSPQGLNAIWRFAPDGTNPEKFIDGVFGIDVYPDGKHLLALVLSGEKTGIYSVSIADRKLHSLLPGVSTFIIHSSRDGKSFVYPVVGTGEILFYRQGFVDGKLTGEPQLALKLPFAFPLDVLNGNAYDFTPDLSKIVYARISGKKDFYLLRDNSR
jgi:Tol biopolymer transport system component